MALSPETRATCIGLLAPIFWGMSLGIVRGIAEGFGLAQGEFLLYLAGTTFVYFFIGLPNFKTIDKRYLWIGVPTASLSSTSFCLAIFLAQDASQSVEVGMVNYIWPALTILFAVLFNGVRARWWLAVGAVMAFMGLLVILGGEKGFDGAAMLTHIQSNPLAYGFALLAGVSWAAFSSMTRAWAGRENVTTLVFILDMAAFAILWLCGVGTHEGAVTTKGIVSVVLGGLAVAIAYAAWMHGLSKGKMNIMALAGYFTPVLSCVFAIFWVDASLTWRFWMGVALVVVGSLICWDATERGVRALPKSPTK